MLRLSHRVMGNWRVYVEEAQGCDGLTNEAMQHYKINVLTLGMLHWSKWYHLILEETRLLLFTERVISILAPQYRLCTPMRTWRSETKHRKLRKSGDRLLAGTALDHHNVMTLAVACRRWSRVYLGHLHRTALVLRATTHDSDRYRKKAIRVSVRVRVRVRVR